MKTIRWGIIGVGDVCEVKSGPGFQKAAGSELVAVMRRDGEKAKDFAERHGVPRWSDDASALLNAPDIDALYIATPPNHHLEYTRAALDAGKNVYVEKPMARNALEARSLLEADLASPNKVCIAHYRRQLPLYQMVQDILRSGELGNPRRVSLEVIQPSNDPLVASSEENWRVQPEISGGGIFHDLAPHQLDLLLMFFGEPETAQGFATRRNHSASCDDCVCGQFRFANNVVVQGYWDFDSQDETVKDNCVIECDRGTLRFSFFRSPHLEIQSPQGTVNHTFEPPQHIQQPMIEKMNAYFRGEGENPCSAATGLVVMEMIDALSSKSESIR